VRVGNAGVVSRWRRVKLAGGRAGGWADRWAEWCQHRHLGTSTPAFRAAIMLCPWPSPPGRLPFPRLLPLPAIGLPCPTLPRLRRSVDRAADGGKAGAVLPPLQPATALPRAGDKPCGPQAGGRAGGSRSPGLRGNLRGGGVPGQLLAEQRRRHPPGLAVSCSS
jgi:hypothetical protein